MSWRALHGAKAFVCAFRRRGEAVRCGEALSLVKHCGLGGSPHEQMLKGFPDLRKVLNPKGGFRGAYKGRNLRPPFISPVPL